MKESFLLLELMFLDSPGPAIRPFRWSANNLRAELNANLKLISALHKHHQATQREDAVPLETTLISWPRLDAEE